VPLGVGNGLVRGWGGGPVGALGIQVLTPTQGVMDRLAAFYHWRDRQGLDQAVLVAAQQIVDLDEIERWSAREGHAEAHREFAACVKKTRIGG